MSMAHSLELRCPFLDAEFAGLCADLCLDDKVQSRAEEAARKVLLKKAFAHLLPAGLVFQPKKGFTIPAYQWLQTRYKDRAKTELERKDSLSATVFDANTRLELFTQAMTGDRLAQYRVWALIVLNKWGDRWL
jgi:asparagine synthase (glutamine-hydrolysing)